MHLVINNNDVSNFCTILDRDEFTASCANAPDPSGVAPLVMCLKNQSCSAEYVSAILRHPTAGDKFDLNVINDGKSLLHMLAEKGNLELWNQVLHRPKCDINLRDLDGNTPVMKAVSGSQMQMLDEVMKKPDLLCKVDPNIKNNDSSNLLMLCIKYMDEDLIKKLVDLLDLKACLNDVNSDGMTPILLAASLGKWNIMRLLLESAKLRDENDEGCVDVHKLDKDGHSCLVKLIVVR